MPDMVMSGPVPEERCPSGAVNIQTSKVFDACRDKDCIEDLRVYPTVTSQALINSAISIRPSSAQLLSAEVSVDPISFKRGYYTVDVTYFYRISGSTFPGGSDITGLAVFDKRVILFGSESAVKVFSSETGETREISAGSDLPVAYVTTVDPIALNMKLVDVGTTPPETETPVIPEYILDAIGEDLVLTGASRQVLVTLGQFSVIRLERPTLLRIEGRRFFPEEECPGSNGGDDDPCALFSKVEFPMEEFLPPDEMQATRNYRDMV